MKKPTKIKKVKKQECDPLKQIKVTLPGLPGGVTLTEYGYKTPRRGTLVVEFTPDWEESLPNPFKEI